MSKSLLLFDLFFGGPLRLKVGGVVGGCGGPCYFRDSPKVQIPLSLFYLTFGSPLNVLGLRLRLVNKFIHTRHGVNTDFFLGVEI